MEPALDSSRAASALSLAAASAVSEASLSNAAAMISAAAASAVTANQRPPSTPPAATAANASSAAAAAAASPAVVRLLATVEQIATKVAVIAPTGVKTPCRSLMAKVFVAVSDAVVGKRSGVPFGFLEAPLSRAEEIALARRAIDLARLWVATTPAESMKAQCGSLLVESWTDCRVDSLRSAFAEACSGDYLASLAPTQEQMQQDEACLLALQFLPMLLRVLQPMVLAEQFPGRLQPLAASFRFLCPADGVTAPVLPVRVQHSLVRLWHEFPPCCPDLLAMRRRVSQGVMLLTPAMAKADPALGLMRSQMIEFLVCKPWASREGAAASSSASAVAASSSAAMAAPSHHVAVRHVLTAKAGLDNLGNTCFINTVLQSLFMTDSLRADLLQVDRAKYLHFLMRGHQPVLHLQTVFAFLTATHRASYRPTAFYASLPEMFRDWSQQDAGEFAKHVLDAVGGGLKKYQRHVLEQTDAAAAAVAAIPADPSLAAAASSSDADAASSSSLPPPSAVSLPARTVVADTAVAMELDDGVRGGAVLATVVDPALSALASPAVVLVALDPPPALLRSNSINAPAASGIDMSADFYFGGQLQSTITCLTCNTRSTKSEAFLELPLALEIEIARTPRSTPRSTPKTSPIVKPADTPTSPPFAPALAQALGLAQAAADNPDFALPAARSMADSASFAAHSNIDDLISGFLAEVDDSCTPMDVVRVEEKSAEDVPASALVTLAPPPVAAAATPAADSPDAADAVAALGVLAVVAQSAPPAAAAAAPCIVQTVTVAPSPPAPTYVVPSGPLHLNAMLDHYFSAETLSGSDAYSCASCKVKRTSTKQLRIVRPVPQHLLLCLKRNKYEMGPSGAIVRSKILKEVKYPCVLKLPVLDACVDGACDASGVAASGREQFRTYVLYSVIFHSGTSAQNGHYYSISRHSDDDALKQIQRLVSATSAADMARDLDSAGVSSDVESMAQAGSWYKCNDSSVAPSSWSELANMTEQHPTDVAYLLFYRSIDALQSPAHRYARMTPADIGTFPHQLISPVAADNTAFVREKKTIEVVSSALVNFKPSTYAAQEAKPSDEAYDADMS